jgi:hypothetical protein
LAAKTVGCKDAISKKNAEQKKISRLSSNGIRKVNKLLDENFSMKCIEAIRIVQSEIRKKYRMKDFRL